MIMASMMTVDVVARAESAADANSDGFLAHAEMRRCAHFLFFIAFGQQFFGSANEEHSSVQIKPCLR